MRTLLAVSVSLLCLLQCQGRLGDPAKAVAAAPEADPMEVVAKFFANKTSKETLELFGHAVKAVFMEPVKMMKADADQKMAKTRERIQSASQAFKSVTTALRENEQVAAAFESFKAVAKKKLNASTVPEALRHFVEEAQRRGNATAKPDASTAATLSFLRKKMQPAADKLANNTLVKQLKNSMEFPKKLAEWVNQTKQSDEVGQRFLDLLHSIPEEPGKKIKNTILPVLAANAAIKEIPMTPSEKAIINLGVVLGMMSPEKESNELAVLAAEEGINALRNYKHS